MTISTFSTRLNRSAVVPSTKGTEMYLSGRSAWVAINPKDGGRFLSAYLLNIAFNGEQKDTDAWIAAILSGLKYPEGAFAAIRVKVPSLNLEQLSILKSKDWQSLEMIWNAGEMRPTPRFSKSFETWEQAVENGDEQRYLELELIGEIRFVPHNSIYRAAASIDVTELASLMETVPAQSTIKTLAEVGEESRNRKKLAAKKVAKRAESLARKQEAANEAAMPSPQVQEEKVAKTFSFLD